jgi:hypothetical protein
MTPSCFSFLRRVLVVGAKMGRCIWSKRRALLTLARRRGRVLTRAGIWRYPVMEVYQR